MRIKIINKSKHKLPKYETKFSAGMDVRANIDKPIVLDPMERTLIKTDCLLNTEVTKCKFVPVVVLPLKRG